MPALENTAVGCVVADAEAEKVKTDVPMDTTTEQPAPLKRNPDEAAQALMEAISKKKANAEAKKKPRRS